MSDVRDAYIKALFELSKTDPAKWATFVEAFKVLTVSELERMTTSPADVAQIAIGMGRRMRELRDEFVGIEAIASKLRK
jgi:hypothetical protein